MAPRRRRSPSPSAATTSSALATTTKRRRTAVGTESERLTSDGAIALTVKRSLKNASSRRTSSLAAPIMALTGGHGASVTSLCFSRDGRRVYSGSTDETAQRWRAGVESETANDCAMIGARGAITGIDATFDDERVVTSDAGGVLRVWDAETGTQVKSYASTRGTTSNDCAAGRGSLVMSVSDDGRACVWDLRVKKRAAKTYEHRTPQTSVAMSGDGERAYTGGVDEVVRAWDARMDDKALMTLKGHSDTITGLAISPCGSYVLSNSMDNTMRMWDTRAYVEGERECKRFVGHSHNFEQALLRCAFNADGTRVAAGSSDSCVYVWDVEDAKLKYKLPGHKGAVAAVAFSPTENPVLASGGADGVIFLGELDR